MASTPQVALVYTLAIGKDDQGNDDQGNDAYKDENERAAAAMAEAESVAVRSTTPLNPTATPGYWRLPNLNKKPWSQKLVNGDPAVEVALRQRHVHGRAPRFERDPCACAGLRS